MLDQNSDRMYWVIGALIVGSILIMAAKGAFQTQFTSILSKMSNTLNTGKSPFDSNGNSVAQFIAPFVHLFH